MTFVIAEIGNNHNGSLGKAKELVAKAAEAGADAIKTQSFRGLDIVAPNVLTSQYPEWDTGGYKYWYEFAESVALPLEEHQELIDFTNELKLDFITTPVSSDIVEFLENLTGIKAYKLASMDLSNLSLLESMAATNKPIVMSTGMGTFDEVLKAVNFFEESRLSILHCVSDYPLDPMNASLGNISHLKKTFQRAEIGFSDHSLGHELAIAAVAMGAGVIEKHFTLDRQDSQPAEHHISMEPIEFKEMVNWIRSIDYSRNRKGWSRSPVEKENKKSFRRSFHYKNDVEAGSVISKSELVFVRPEDGIDYDDLELVLGQVVSKNKKAFEPVLIDDFNIEH